MKLLLDTHIWLWSLLAPSNLAPAVSAALESPDSEIWLSPISAWEALLLVERGRILVDGDPLRGGRTGGTRWRQPAIGR